MPKQNNYLAQRRQRDQLVFDIGVKFGRQQILDYLSLALRDPQTMGKDTFSGTRIIRVLKKIDSLMDEFYPAFDLCDEADYYQEKLDRLLREAYGSEIRDGFFSFRERYEVVKQFDYRTRKWR